MTPRKLAGMTITLAAITTIYTSAALADGPEAVATAANHAGFAAGQDNIAGAKTHLHHVLNCLVGPEGEGFDASAGNPCGDTGGAIPQTGDADARERLDELAMQVREAIASDDAAAVKETAMSVQKALEM
jgi:hypothetical protein